jgi:hypothetical protein
MDTKEGLALQCVMLLNIPLHTQFIQQLNNVLQFL